MAFILDCEVLLAFIFLSTCVWRVLDLELVKSFFGLEETIVKYWMLQPFGKILTSFTWSAGVGFWVNSLKIVDVSWAGNSQKTATCLTQG